MESPQGSRQCGRCSAHHRGNCRTQHGSRGRGRDGGRSPPPAQIRTCRITAYGSYLGCMSVEALMRIRMQDPGTRKLAARKACRIVPRCIASALAPPARSVCNQTRATCVPEGSASGLDIARDSMVVEVPLHHPAEPAADLRDRRVHTSRQLLSNRLEFGAQPLANGLPLDDGTIPIRRDFATDVSETQEVERLRLAPLPWRAAWAAKRPNSISRVLSGCSARPNSSEPRPASPPGIVRHRLAVLESQDEIVRVPNDDDIARGMPPPPLLRPQVEDVVQVHVGKQRRDHRSLRCTHRTSATICRPRRPPP